MPDRSARPKPPIPASIAACDPAWLDFETFAGCDWLYTYYDRDGAALYVGRAVHPYQRAGGHRSKSVWWRFVANADVIQIDLRDPVFTEPELIAARQPLFNIRQADPGSPVRAIEYAAHREAWDIVDQLIAKLGACPHCGEITLPGEAASPPGLGDLG